MNEKMIKANGGMTDGQIKEYMYMYKHIHRYEYHNICDYVILIYNAHPANFN